jgi:ribose transport system ATP-binding protein
MNGPVLRAEGISKNFPGIRALDDVSIELRAHEVVGLVGENGAGKSTLLKVLGGLYPPDNGRVILRGKPVCFGSIFQAANAGVGMVFQEQSLLPNISVAENILLGHEDRALRRGFYNWSLLYQQAATQLDKLGAKISPSTRTDALSFAERQVVELAKVLAIEERTQHESVILLDEPTSVLDAGEVETVLNLIEILRARASVVFVSHRLDEVLRVSDRIYVLTNGRCVAERDRKQCDVIELQQLMLGRELSKEYAERGSPLAADWHEVRLSVRDLGRRNSYEAVNFDLHAGEVLGIAGVQGSGRESLCRTLFGAEEADSGVVLLGGRPLRLVGPADAVRFGIGYVPSERRTEGIIAGLGVRENMTLAHLDEFRRGPAIDFRRERQTVKRWINRLRIKTASQDAPVSNLSGGNQQKIVLAKWLIAQNPKVLILDHPLRGLDVGVKAEIFPLIREFAQSGIGILLIADTLDELIALSDSIIVMKDGAISGRFPATGTKPSQLQILERMV